MRERRSAVQTSANNKKVLLRISNLKQYFPLKKKGLFVKANDGITLDIYEGETFGLVGESGCGKSTLGRTLLQLYRQTDGRSMYYGRSLDEIAPRYVEQTLKTIDKRRTKWQELARTAASVKKEYDALPDGEDKYKKYNDLAKANKDANDAMLDMANLVGGFLALEDMKEPVALLLRDYGYAIERKKLRAKRSAVQLDLDDALFYAEKAEKAGDKPNRSKIEKLKQKAAALDASIEAMNSQMADVRAQLDELRRKHAGEAEFDRFEAMRDEGIDLARLEYPEIRLLRSDLQLIFQDPYSSLNPRMTVGNIIGEGLLAHGFFKRNDERMQEYIVKTMEDAGLASYFLHRFPHQFSGGQRQRIGIARSLAVKPKFVVCDEAVSALDVSIQSQIINLLYDLKQQSNLTYLFITHDLSVVKYISDRIGVMYLGNMVELAPTQELFDHPRHPYTEALMAAIPTTDVDSERELRILEGDIPSPVNPPKGCKFHTRCSRSTEICKHAVPEWVEIAPNHFVACHHPLETEA
ncbi:MAG: ATP-binding cassette domain-containing protein [Clostridia bacterium]|nr:ATP-binding cassette domain-containing protein [Clostridia bacterium]